MNAPVAVSLRSFTVRAIAWLPALALLFLILCFSVDVPYWDDWGGEGLVLKDVLEGERDYSAIFLSQSLESREVVPRLIFVAVGLTVGWHVTVFMVLSWLCACLAFLALVAVMPRRTPSHRVSLLATLLLGSLLFSPIQAENWLWAFQIMQFIPPACLAVCLWLHTRRRSIRFEVLSCAALSTIATFSPPNGMLCWFLAFPFVPMATEWRATAEGRRRALVWTAVYLGLAGLVLGFHFWDYRKPPNSPPLDVVLHDPILGLQLFLAWVGAPLTAGLPKTPESATHLATCLGAAILSLFTLAAALVLARRRTAATASWPWLCLAGYGIATGAATTVGRAGMGPATMMGPRYYTQSLWVTIGLLGLLHALWSSGQSRRRVRDVGFASVAAAAALLTVFSWLEGVRRMDRDSARSRQNLLTLRLVDAAPDNPLWQRMHPTRRSVDIARFLLDRGVLETELIGRWIQARLGEPDARVGGRFRLVGTSDGRLRLVGWAALPERGSPADCVVFATQDPSGHFEIVTGLVVEGDRPESFVGLGEPGTPRAWFDDEIEYRHAENLDLMMFAVDLDRRRVYRLGQDQEGSRTVVRTFVDHLGAAEVTEARPGGVGRAARPFKIDGKRRMVLAQHTDSDVVFRGVRVEHGDQLEFGAGINESAWDQPGDGVMFEIDVIEPGSTSTTLFSQWLDPKNDPRDRRWVDRRIDLASYGGRSIDIRFRTTAGPAGDTRNDWAGWSGPHIVRDLNLAAGLVSLSFGCDAMRIEHPMRAHRLELRGQFSDGREADLGTHFATRVSSSDPGVIEVTDDLRLVAHRWGRVEVIARNGERRARLAVETSWAPVIPYGTGSPGKAGIVPVLEAANPPARVGHSNFQLRVSRVIGNAKGMLIAVADPAASSITEMPRLVPLDGDAVPLRANGLQDAAARGSARLVVPLPADPTLAGTIVYWQGVFADDHAVLGFSVSNGLIVTIQ